MSPFLATKGIVRPPGSSPRNIFDEILLIASGLVLVFLIALLEYSIGPWFSCSIFHFVPVVACAWWGGFPHAVLVALAGSVAWSVVELLAHPLMPQAATVWNAVVHFGVLALASSVVCRLHVGVLHERWLARTDPLTGAVNARTFYETTAIEVERAGRTARPLTLAYFDLDNFKQLNDQLGHAAGDEALMQVVQLIQARLRSMDLLARLGGDEFGILLPETDASGATLLLTRLQEVLSQEMTRKDWPIKFSVGAITFLRPKWDVDQMIQRVDALMYLAKRKGKGRIEHAVIQDDLEIPQSEVQAVERRAAARLLCDKSARVHLGNQQQAQETVAKLRDISAGGVGLYLESRFDPDTILVIEPFSGAVKTLLARVVRVTPDGTGWIHGCVLSAHLNAEELSDWLGSRQALPGVPPVCPSRHEIDTAAESARC